jgi:hypothetical protein
MKNKLKLEDFEKAVAKLKEVWEEGIKPDASYPRQKIMIRRNNEKR